MKKTIRRIIGVLLVSCILVSMFCMTAFAKSASGTYNGRTYRVSLVLQPEAMTSNISYPNKIQLGFLGYGEARLGNGYRKVSCSNNGMNTRIAKTVNPGGQLRFVRGHQEYYIESHYVKTLDA